MAEYKIAFRRYDAAKGETRISVPFFIPFDSFDGAYNFARRYLSGAQEADPSRTYSIECIETYGGHYRAIVCDGAHRWETREELTARIGEEG